MSRLEIDLSTLSVPEGGDYYVLLGENCVSNNSVPSMAITDPTIITMHSPMYGISDINNNISTDAISGGYGVTHNIDIDEQIEIWLNKT